MKAPTKSDYYDVMSYIKERIPSDNSDPIAMALVKLFMYSVSLSDELDKLDKKESEDA